MSSSTDDAAYSDTTINWMPEPNVRGTFELLRSCLITLSLCVYAAVHLNVPCTTDKSKLLAAQVKWILCGMFAPELVVFTAWSQWISARELMRTVEQCNKGKDPSMHYPDWSMKHNFFAQMGGFAIDTKDHGEEYIPESPRVHLTANGAAVLAQQGRLPRVTEQFISDKSKANSLAKVLVVIQAGWLIVECIGRAVAGLPITLLEINTVAHVVCALMMYALWWHKPLNISEPVVIKGDGIHSFCSAMWMFSEFSSQKDHEFTKKFERSEFESLIRYEILQQRSNSLREPCMQATSNTGDVEKDADTSYSPDNCTSFGTRQSQHPTARQQLRNPPNAATHHNDEICSFLGKAKQVEPSQQELTVRTMRPFSHGEVLSNIHAVQCVDSQKSFDIRVGEEQALFPMGFGPNSEGLHPLARNVSRNANTNGTPGQPVHIEVDKIRLNRWSLAAACLDRHPNLWARHQRRLPNIRSQDGVLWTRTEYPNELCKTNYVNVRIPNWPGNDLIWRNKGLAVGFFVACGTIYGAIHLSAWNAHFPSSPERLCWRISAISLAGSAFLFSLASVYDGPFLAGTRENGSEGTSRQGWRGWCIRWGIECVRTVFGSMLFICGVVYVCARGFLVVEAFISLRALPREAYDTPQWSQYLSHL
ncbi:hypothetical protein EDD37DRAFT_277949 [Exophiala viscosa]|uniref:uncharacterized protein n=1 Tax=Exophiala viscosa TaxID=2486360 RepID=UPI0021A0C9F9|nr:hypothetical protein EDD37DRAFT_277949 [Exophiala viscosa]